MNTTSRSCGCGQEAPKASHGIRDRRTSKGKARFQSLLGKRAPTGSADLMDEG